MSTQYNSIQAPYDSYRKASIALLERNQVRSLLSASISGARVLELACGSGFYTHHFLDWGAKSVVAADISSAMLEQASRGITVDPSRVKFIEQDCSKAQEIDGGGFDLAFGAWFLNYAATREELVEMFRLIAMNLKEGGRFVGITCPPTADPAAFVQAERDLRLAPQGSGGLLCSINYEVKDGVYFHVFADTEAGEVNFDCWHLLKRVYEEAAREGGMNGVLEWSATEVTDEFIRTREGGASVEELESYRKVPHYGMLVVGK